MRAGPATAWDVAAAACGILADGFAAENLAASVMCTRNALVVRMRWGRIGYSFAS